MFCRMFINVSGSDTFRFRTVTIQHEQNEWYDKLSSETMTIDNVFTFVIGIVSLAFEMMDLAGILWGYVTLV